ncbi:MAG: oligoribonuclease [Acidobacteria bacterium]|nr:oligoribonuclease [Acidobacteriota bacterium]
MNRMLWMDLEMTGLDPNTCHIIEIAAVVTDVHLSPLHQYHKVVYQPPEILETMDAWNQKTHSDSGLLAAIPNGTHIDSVERDLVGFVDAYFENERPVICGNSIHQDRKFIDKYLPAFAQKLHYRMIDVSAFKQVFDCRYGITFKKNGGHRAVDDILESIAELNHYLSFIKLEVQS